MATVVWMQVKLPSLLLFCSFLWSCHATRHTLFGRPRGGLLGAPKVPVDAMLPGEQWLTQNLDHFNPADTRTWQQVIAGEHTKLCSDMYMSWPRSKQEQY